MKKLQIKSLSVSRNLVAGMALLMPLLSIAACPKPEALAAFVEDYKARRLNDDYAKGWTMDDAKCARRQLIDELTKHLGPVTGYRLLFSNDETRAMRQLETPVWGAMFGNVLLTSPAKVPSDFSAAPLWEPDLLVEVKGPGIAEAKTHLNALRHISALVPYLDLKDAAPSSPTVANLSAVNALFRTGVLGQRIPIKPDRKTIRMLRDLSVEGWTDGTLLTKTPGTRIMNGHPLNAVMWLAQELKKEGIVLKKGDLLAIGSFAAGQRPNPGMRIMVRYVGLPGNPSVSAEIGPKSN